MSFMRKLSIRRKQLLLIMGTTTVSLLLACSTFVVYDAVTFRREMVENLSSLAGVVGNNVTAAIDFQDSMAAEETLSALRGENNIDAARIYNRAGDLFAAYARPGHADAHEPPAGMTSEHAFHNDHLFLFLPIAEQGDQMGAILLVSNLEALTARLWRYAGIVGLVFALSSIVALFLSTRLERLITAPIQTLAALTRSVAEEKDYARRAQRTSDDEVGQLVDSFNEMLAQIQARDADLRAARDKLEERVEERTVELQEALAESARDKARFQLIFEAVPVGISLRRTEPDGRLSTFLLNDAHEQISGVSREMTDDPEVFARLTHAEDYERQKALLDELDRGQIDQFTLEKRYLRADGLVWVSFSVQRRRYDDGSYEDLSTLVDVTDLKRAQEEAAREQARFKFIFDSVPVGISWLVPGDEATHLVNPAHQRITGVTAEESRVAGAFARVSHPEDYKRQQALIKRFVSGEIDHYSVEKRYIHADGRTVWCVLSSRMFVDPASGNKQSVTTLVDITDLKHAQVESAREQARFKFIFDAVPVGFTWMRCGDLSSRMVNPAHARITGVPFEDCQKLELYHAATHPDDRARQDQLHQRIISGDTDHYQLEKRYIHPDGTTRWTELSVRHFRDPVSGEVQEISTLVDTTERKKAEEQLEQVHKELLQASRQAGMAEVATGVLHNVGNVLNSVNVSATIVAESVRKLEINNLARVAALLRQHQDNLGEFFGRDPKAAQVPRFVEALAEHMGSGQSAMLKELEDLRKNVEHIKDIVAMQQSYAKVSGVAEDVPVVELVEDALRMNAGALTRHDVSLVRDFQSRRVVEVEKHKVLQILVNLIRNAKYACDDSRRTDKVLTVRTEDEEDAVKIAVTDNGVGIPGENLTRIFSHGFTTRKSGHGFGLHSGALAAKELGGSLTVASEGAGRGATFTLMLPIRTAKERAA